MTKLISVLLILLVVWVGWKVFTYYQEVDQQQAREEKAATGADLLPSQLPGLPSELHHAYDLAQRRGAAGLRDFLAAHAHRLQDPRRGWIELDYCTALLRDDPREAKRIYTEVKARVSTNSVIYPRIRQLEKTFE